MFRYTMVQASREVVQLKESKQRSLSLVLEPHATGVDVCGPRSISWKERMTKNCGQTMKVRTKENCKENA